MFLAVWLIVAFFVGIPFSFGIGYLIGHIVCKVSKVKRGEDTIRVLSGITYIISQPISYIIFWYLVSHIDIAIIAIYEYASYALLVLIALVVTTIVSIIIMKIVSSYFPTAP